MRSVSFVIETVKVKWDNREGEQGYRVHVVLEGVIIINLKAPGFNQQMSTLLLFVTE